MPYTLKGLLEVYEDMVEILLMLQVFLAEDPEIEYLFCGAPSGPETCLLIFNHSLLSLVACLGHIFSPAVPTPLQTAGLCRVIFS